MFLFISWFSQASITINIQETVHTKINRNPIFK